MSTPKSKIFLRSPWIPHHPTATLQPQHTHTLSRTSCRHATSATFDSPLLKPSSPAILDGRWALSLLLVGGCSGPGLTSRRLIRVSRGCRCGRVRCMPRWWRCGGWMRWGRRCMWRGWRVVGGGGWRVRVIGALRCWWSRGCGGWCGRVRVRRMWRCGWRTLRSIVWCVGNARKKLAKPIDNVTPFR